MRKEHAPPFFAPISGPARNGKQGRCAHTCYFAWPGAPQKCLLGSSPNPPDFWTLCPEVLVVCGPGAIAPGPCGIPHRGLFSFPPAPAAAFSARPSSGASHRPAGRSWRPLPPGSQKAPPHAGPDTF